MLFFNYISKQAVKFKNILEVIPILIVSLARHLVKNL